MIRLLLSTAVALSCATLSHGAESWIQRITIEADDSSDYSEGDFFQALMGAFYGAGDGEWGPGENPNGWETPDRNEITIEPGDLLPDPDDHGPIWDNGNCMDWYWEVPETRGCG